MGTVAATITDGVRFRATDALYTARTATIAELVVVAPAATRRWRAVATLREALRVTARVAAPSAILAVSMVSAIVARTITTFGHGATLRSGVRVAATLRPALGVTLRSRVAIRLQQAAGATFGRTITSRVRVTSRTAVPGLFAVLRSALRVVAAATGLRRAIARVTDHVEVEDVLAHKLLITVVSRSTVALDDTLGLAAIYAVLLSDGIDFIVDTVDPGGDVTTWAMNTRTGAVSEYLNFSFNSFARSGNGTYLGADAGGLYELTGPDDAGTPVIADMIGGLVDFSASFLSGMQAVYLGVRGSGEFFLRLSQGDGRQVTYAVSPTSLRTSRINVGKGLRATYYTWELLSTGQDFDLTSIVFLPIQQTRRI